MFDIEKIRDLLKTEPNTAYFWSGLGADGLEKDKEKAIEWLNRSADSGNIYAQNLLNENRSFENTMLANTVFSLFVNLSRCIEDDHHRKLHSGRKMIDSKLRRVIREKKLAMGIKEEQGQTQYE